MDGQLAVRRIDRNEPRGAMPPPAPLSMPVQDLRRAPPLSFADHFDWRTILARAITIAGTVGIVAYGVTEMIAIVSNDQMTHLQVLFIVFFGITLSWIAQSAAAAAAGLLPQRRLALPGHEAARALQPHRTALVMPIYNEDPLRTTMALRAIAEELARDGIAQGFEIVLLSDSTRADPWIRESIAVQRLRESLDGVMPVFYRRRWANIHRKSGNLQDFVERWGARYEHMVVLDADSLVDSHTLARLVQAMQADAQLALLQTVPMLVGRMSLLARLQQFAGRVYGPPVARGVAAWSGDDGNYWGHNAILRVAAFADSCGLPELRGRKPFGGHILSHDFVEAALLRRRGWKVRMLTGAVGSYEESPPSLIDFAIRDRRWAQGNLQHAKLLGTRGLSTPSRLHFFFGIMSYLASPLWMVLLLLGFALSVQAGLHDPQYFRLEFQLFPDWPRFDAPRMFELFLFSVVVLFLPKAIGLLRALFSRSFHRTVGVVGLVASAAVELVLSALYAPVLMLMQSRSVIEILLGRDAGWASQTREEGRGSWREAWRIHWGHTLAGVLFCALFALLAPQLLPWLTPVLAGLLLSVPLSRFSSSVTAGRLLHAMGLLRTPEEVQPPALVQRRDQLLAEAEPLPTDALRALAGDDALRAAHVDINPPQPPPPRGRPDADWLTAERKVRDARTLPEALGWLSPAERVRVAADEDLLERLSHLAARQG